MGYMESSALGLYGIKCLIVDAGSFGQIVKISMLENNVPTAIIHSLNKICNSDFGNLVLFVGKLYMLMYFSWTLVRGELYKRCIVINGCVYAHSL